MSDASDLTTVLVPVRDFAKGLPRFLDGWHEAFQKLGRTFRFVIIDDGSTVPIPESTSGALVVLPSGNAMGLGASLRTACGEFDETVLTIVPDFAYRPSDLRSLFDAFKDVDMVIGVRPGQKMPTWLSAAKRIGQFLRRWLFGIPATDMMAWYGWPAARRRLRYRFIYGPRLQDPGTGLLLIRRSILERCPIQSNGAFAILELIAKANFLGATISEVKLGKPSDMPVMKGRFENIPSDERIVFRHPRFLPAKSTTGTDETSSIPVAMS